MTRRLPGSCSTAKLDASTFVPAEPCPHPRTRVEWAPRAVDLDGIDLHDDLVDTVTAAALAKVKPSTISAWQRRGHLPIAGRTASGRPRYRPIDVAKAEHKTRTSQQSRRHA